MNTWSVWFIILVILSYSNGCKSVGGVTMYFNMVVFGIFEKHMIASQGYLERFAHFSKTKLNMVCNKLKKYFEEVTTFLSLLWQL